MNNLQFDFLANKDNNTLTIRREFNAEKQLVWDCYTKQELLDQWFHLNHLLPKQNQWILKMVDIGTMQ
jgi:uncharacterized protein YndB with AHSA1/START domain